MPSIGSTALLLTRTRCFRRRRAWRPCPSLHGFQPRQRLPPHSPQVACRVRGRRRLCHAPLSGFRRSREVSCRTSRFASISAPPRTASRSQPLPPPPPPHHPLPPPEQPHLHPHQHLLLLLQHWPHLRRPHK